LEAAPSDFMNCGRIISREKYSTPMNSFDFFGEVFGFTSPYLQLRLAKHTAYLDAVRTLTRFRYKEEGSYNFVVVPEFEAQGLQMQARYYVMISSRDTALKNVAQKFIYIRQDALREQGASNGILNLHVTLREESAAGQPMFVVKLAVMQTSHFEVILELRQLDLKLELVNTLQEDKIRLEAIGLGQQIKEKMASLELMEGEIEAVGEKIRELGDERRLLVDELEKRFWDIDLLTIRATTIEQRQDKLSEEISQTQQHLDDLLHNEFVANGLQEYGY
jgi:hypothetical protein